MSIAPPPIAAAPEAPDAGAYRAPATDLLAMLGMLSSAAGLSLFPVLGSMGGIALGAIALLRIRRAGTEGRPLAIGAIVLGVAGLAVSVATVLFITAIVIEAAQSVP